MFPLITFLIKNVQAEYVLKWPSLIDQNVNLHPFALSHL
jgi:hypothetical protein